MASETAESPLTSGYSAAGMLVNEEVKRVHKTEKFIVKFCFWFPIIQYELFLIYAAIAFFVLWFVMLFLTMTYFKFGSVLIHQSFLMENHEEGLRNWVQSQDLYPFRAPSKVFKVEVLVERIIFFKNNILFREGLTMIMIGSILLMVNGHGFFAFYYHHDLNMLIYSITLIIVFVVIQFQVSILLSLDTSIIKEIYSNVLQVKKMSECLTCWPNLTLETGKWPPLSVNDYLFLSQSCLFNCCQLSILYNSSIYDQNTRGPPFVCCKSFMDIAMSNNTKTYITDQLRCVKNLANTTFEDGVYDPTRCTEKDLLPPCIEVFRKNINFKFSQQFFHLFADDLIVLGYYYLLISFLCIMFLLEKNLAKGAMLRKVNLKLQNYSIH